MYQNQEIDPRLSGWFEALGETPRMDEQRRCELRGNFLVQAQRIALTAPQQAWRRQDGWVYQLRLIFNQTFGQKPRLQFAAALAAALIMLICAGGITTYAAQSSLPDQPLYSLKLWSEAVRLNAAGSGQDWQLALEFAERRAAEIRRMVVNGQSLPATLQMRLMLQMDKALQLAVSRPDDEARQALEQVRRRFEEQEQEMVMLQGGFGPQADAALSSARETIRERIRWAESGIQEPNQLREHFRLGLQKPEITPGAQEQRRTSGTAAPGGPNQYGVGECPDCTPQGPQNGGNPWVTGTPTPGSGYGEGQGGNPWTSGTPTPGSGYGPGPNPTGTPTPGSGYGPGPNPTSTPAGQGGSGSGGNTGGSNTPEPAGDPGPGSGPNPTDDSGGGSGSQPTDTSPGGGGQPGQGGTHP